MKRTLLILASTFTAAGITTYGIIPPLHQHVANGGSQWWLLALLIPAVMLMIGIGMAAVGDSKRDSARWHRTYQDEQAAQARTDAVEDTFRTARHALWANPYGDHPLNLAGRPAVLTDAQRELAAEHAADKRYCDGLGDQ